ncbi:DUF3090 domain-containing protein [soil metagenome]
MPRRVFSFDRPDRFVAGAVGQPGQRTFFLQATKGGQVVSVVLEKAQVAALAERLATLLIALRQTGVDIGEQPTEEAATLVEPLVEEFRAGTLTLGWDADREQVVIEALELGIDEEEDEDEETGPTIGELAPADEADEDDGDAMRVQLAPDEAFAFASSAAAIVQAGRPPCPQCGAPLDPTGHFCTRRNGYTH